MRDKVKETVNVMLPFLLLYSFIDTNVPSDSSTLTISDPLLSFKTVKYSCSII